MRPTSNVLKKIKSDFMNRNRISKDIQVDVEAAKVLCEHLCLYSSPGKLSGYVQDISQNPFGFLLMSDIQVS